MTSIQLDSGGGAGGGGGGGATNLGYTAQPASGIVTSSTGTSATIPVVDATNAGLMTPAQRAALIAAAGTNLSYTASPTNGTVVSDTGTDATIPAVDATNAGLMLPAQRAALQDAITTPAQGDLLYYNGTAWVKLPAGTSGQFLKTNGAGANPAWAASGGGGGSVATDAIWTAKGQIAAATGVGAAVALAAGADGTRLFADANAASGLTYGYPERSLYAGATAIQYAIGTGGQSSQSAATAQTCFWWPFFLYRRATLDAMMNWVWTAEAGSTLRMGVYVAGANVTPTTLIADYGTVSGASTGSKSATGSTSIGPGLVFLAAWASNHTTVRWSKPQSQTSPSMLFGEIGLAVGQYGQCWQATAVDYSAGLPASAPALTLVSTTSNPVSPGVRFT